MKRQESWNRCVPGLILMLSLMIVSLVTLPNGMSKVAMGLFFSILIVTYVEGALEKQGQLSIWNREEKPMPERDPSEENQKLDSLYQQINPHFLYNTLESIRGKAMVDGAEEVADMTEALSSFFRYCIGRKNNVVTLADELHNVQEYFRIQQFRFDNRFELTVSLPENDDVRECLIPKLTLQPLVENAIVHGLEARAAKGKMTIRVLAAQEGLTLYVSDDGVGMESQKIEQFNQLLQHDGQENSEPVQTGIALRNINNRIRLLFGDSYGLTLFSTLGLGTTVEIRLPRLNQLPGGKKK